MLLSTYDPDSEARCPKCKKLVKCQTVGGNLAFGRRYLDFHHKDCDTAWRYYLDGETIVAEGEK